MNFIKSLLLRSLVNQYVQTNLDDNKWQSMLNEKNSNNYTLNMFPTFTSCSKIPSGSHIP